MGRVAYVIRRPGPIGNQISHYDIGVQEAGATEVTEPIMTLTVNEAKFTDATAGEETAMGAATVTAIRAVTAFYTKTEI